MATMVASRHSQFGFIHNLILPSLAILGIVVVGIGAVMDRNQRGISIAESTTRARDQLTTIRDALTLCRVTWPGGNNGTGFNVNYPATPGAGTWGDVSAIICPGPSANLWTALNISLPPAPNWVSGWQYQNSASGILLKIDALQQDGEYVLAQVAQRIPATEKTLTTTSLQIKLKN